MLEFVVSNMRTAKLFVTDSFRGETFMQPEIKKSLDK